MNDYRKEVQNRIDEMSSDSNLINTSKQFLMASTLPKYSYNFTWMGRPIIQYPQDMVALQEIIWQVKPDLIIETGIAHGGSLIFSASMMALLDMSEVEAADKSKNLRSSKRKVLGIDIDIRPHNKTAIEAHPMASRIKMIQGSSIDAEIIEEVKKIAKQYDRILVLLDSNHTKDHVLAELEAYAPLVSIGSYCIVFDTLIEDMPKTMYPDRLWGPGNNPKNAVWEYLEKNPDYEIDKTIPQKLLITVAHDGYLKKIS